MYVSNEVYEKVKAMRNAPGGHNKMAVMGREVMIPTRWGKARALYYPPAVPQEKAPVFFNVHGGGFIMGKPEMDDPFCARLAQELNIAVLNLEYRLAPEYSCPSDKEDVYDMVKYVSSHPDAFSIDPDRMAIGGHSAGGNISAVVCLMAAKEKEFSFRCQVLDYPPIDIAKDPFEKLNIPGVIPPEVASTFDACYRLPEKARDPYCSPIYAGPDEFAALPPAIVLTCEVDSLRDEGEEYALALARAGVEVSLKRFHGVSHGFHPMEESAKDQWEAGQLMIHAGLRRYLLG